MHHGLDGRPPLSAEVLADNRGGDVERAAHRGHRPKHIDGVDDLGGVGDPGGRYRVAVVVDLESEHLRSIGVTQKC